MVTITLYVRQQKRHWCIEQSFGLCGRGRGSDDLGEWHLNMYNIIYETSCQSRFDARYWMLGVGALGWPTAMVWGGRREEGSGWGTHVYLWRIHIDIWQNQYNIVKLKKKISKLFPIPWNLQSTLAISARLAPPFLVPASSLILCLHYCSCHNLWNYLFTILSVLPDSELLKKLIYV